MSIIGGYIFSDFNILLTVHLSITLVNAQLDPQLFYFIIRLLQSSTCYEQCRAHHREVKLHLVYSRSISARPVCRSRGKSRPAYRTATYRE